MDKDNPFSLIAGLADLPTPSSSHRPSLQPPPPPSSSEPDGGDRRPTQPAAVKRQQQEAQTLPMGIRLERPLRVLVVDDNAINLRVLREILIRKLSYLIDPAQVQLAASGPEALQWLGRTEFDTVFLDISMPGMSGLEVCRRMREAIGSGEPGEEDTPAVQAMREANRAIDVCAFTTDLADWQVDMYRRSGMNGCIGKPLREADLAFALQITNLAAPYPSPAFSNASEDSAGSSDPSIGHSSSSSSSALSSRRLVVGAAGVGGGLIPPHVNPGRARYPFYFRRYGQDHPLPSSFSPFYPSPSAPASVVSSGERRRRSVQSSGTSPASVPASRRPSAAPTHHPLTGAIRMDSDESTATIRRPSSTPSPSLPSPSTGAPRPDYDRQTSFGSVTTDSSSASVQSSQDASTATSCTTQTSSSSSSAVRLTGKEPAVVVRERNPFEKTFGTAFAHLDLSSHPIIAGEDVDVEPDQWTVTPDPVEDSDDTPSPKAVVVDVEHAPDDVAPPSSTTAVPTVSVPGQEAPGTTDEATTGMAGFFNTMASQPNASSSRPRFVDPWQTSTASSPLARASSAAGPDLSRHPSPPSLETSASPTLPGSSPSGRGPQGAGAKERGIGATNAKMQLLARRSQPDLYSPPIIAPSPSPPLPLPLPLPSPITASTSSALPDDLGRVPATGVGSRLWQGRRRRSEGGERVRPTWQLVALGKEQSVLKDGPLLDEMLEGLDREDRRKKRMVNQTLFSQHQPQTPTHPPHPLRQEHHR